MAAKKPAAKKGDGDDLGQGVDHVVAMIRDSKVGGQLVKAETLVGVSHNDMVTLCRAINPPKARLATPDEVQAFKAGRTDLAEEAEGDGGKKAASKAPAA